MNKTRRHWAGVLASLLSPANPAAAFDAMLVVLPFLDDFPDAAFCVESAKAVAQAERYGPVPAYDAVAKALRGWWRDNRPHIAALPAPQPQSDWRPPTEAEKVAVALKVRQHRADVEVDRIAEQPAKVEARCLSPNDLAAAYREQLVHGATPMLRAMAATRLAMLEGA